MMTPQEIESRASVLFHGEGWPLVSQLFADLESEALKTIRDNPTGPEAAAACVRLATVETMRNCLRGIAPSSVGDPFHAREHTREPVPEPEPEPAGPGGDDWP